MKKMTVRLFFVCIPAVAAMAQMTAVQTVKGLRPSEGLEVTLWAAEPLVTNPTNIDIDERGRVWYLEAVNYRRKLKNQPDLRKAGDRIVILEDTDADGKADKKTVFDQNPELRSPLGIAVLGDKVVVSQSPDLIVYTKDAADKIVKKEVLLTGWGGLDHDHGLHAVKFGHDGRWYFNSGDQGFDTTDKSGYHTSSSRKGEFFAGTVLRVNPDGTGFKVLAHNFRNPYELALDSFGGIWQSDNDDDGNAWTRFNYVMEGGNYGYWGPGGRSWREDRASHFHGENPGVAPNIARLGAGSPCGLIVYEGKLLPERYRGQPMHAEAGKRQINTYLIEREGAGYSLKVENTIAGADTWFRPSDLAVSPDGALFVADWYDPGVGGHNMGDSARGRIYRLAPAGYKTQRVAVDLDSPAGLSAGLASPNQAIRHLAYARLRNQGAAAVPVLLAMWKQEDDAVLRARALWLLAALGNEGRPMVNEALRSSDLRFRTLALRLYGLYYPGEFVRASKPYWSDASPQIRREIAVLMQHYPIEESGDALEALARQYDGKDRWYLEALGIGMAGKESAMYARLQNAFGGRWDERYARLLWRLRVPESLDALSKAAADTTLGEDVRKQAVLAMAEQREERAMAEVAGVIADDAAPAPVRQAALERMSQRLFSEWSAYRSALPAIAAVQKGLETPALRKDALALAEELEESKYGPALVRMAKDGTLPEDLRISAIQATGRTKVPEYVSDLDALTKASQPMPVRLAAVRALGAAQPQDLNARMQRLVLSKEDNMLRSEALRVLSRGTAGSNAILDLEQKQTLPAELRNLACNLLATNREPAIRARAAKLLPPPVASNRAQLPHPRSIVATQGDVATGRKVFHNKLGANCIGCHAIEEGKPTVGPNLGAIGDKLGKEALLDAILNPSAGIAHEYVTWILDTRSQGQVIGVLAEDTPQRVAVKTETGEEIRLKPGEITGRRKSNLSMMPEDLVTKMTSQQLIDLLEFLTTLKDTRRAAAN